MQGVRRGVRLLRVLENRASGVRGGALARSGGVIACDDTNSFSFGASTAAGKTADGLQLRERNFTLQAMGMCTQTGSEGAARVRKGNPTGDARKLYEEMVTAMEKKNHIPNPRQLQELIQSASTAPEVALAMDVAGRVRRESKKELPHTKEVTHTMVSAFLRAGDTQGALRLLWRKNPDGFTTSSGCANLLLKHAKFHKDVKLMRQVLRAMAANGVPPTQTSADMTIRMCKEAGETALMFSLAREYHTASLTFHDSLFDILISSAANVGDPKLVNEIQTWRVNQGLQHTTASAVSMAKALVLERKPKEAAVMIKDHCPADGAAQTQKRERYLSIMVKVWPLQLLTSLSVESREEYLRKLKEDVACMFDSLKDLGLTFDGGEHFAQGKGSGSVAQKEVMVR